MIEMVAMAEDKGPKILVIGVGGGGNNAVDRMIEANLDGVTFAVVNTDAAVLDNSRADIKLQIGERLLKGYGAGADPLLGEAAATESESDIKQIVEGKDMVIVTCGMGGGTGTGASPVIAKICRESGILTMGVVTTPFSFENRPRMEAAKVGVEKLKENVDTLLVIPNDKLLTLSDKVYMLDEAFVMADSVLRYTIEGITNIVFNRGIINIDFNDVKTTLANKGIGHLGIGTVGENEQVIDAMKKAVNSPLLETNIAGAENLLVNTSGKINLVELNNAIGYLREIAGEAVNIIWGTVTDTRNSATDVVVTVIATGMPEKEKRVGYAPPKVSVPTLTDISKRYVSETNIKPLNNPEIKVIHREPAVSRPIKKEIQIPDFLRQPERGRSTE